MTHISAATTLRILYVEDNAFLREQILLLLTSDDREVIGCGSAEEAMMELGKRPFDVLITDISLPRMSGMELAKQVLKSHPDAWIVISSGYLPNLHPKTLGPHVRVLPKPFEIEQVDAVLREVRDSLAAQG